MTHLAARLGAHAMALSAWIWMTLVYFSALLPRLAFVIPARQAPLTYDEMDYHIIATSLASGRGFHWYFNLPTAFRPPGYPFLISLLYRVTGASSYVARVSQCFIAALTPTLTYILARRMVSEGAARLSAVLMLVYIPLVLYTLALLTEMVFIPLMLAAMLMLLRARRTHSLVDAIVCGLILGGAILVRSDFTFFLPFIALWLYWPERDFRAAARVFLPIVIVVTVMVIPWCVRNYNTTGQFVYLDTRAGYNLFIGYREDADGAFNMPAAQEMVDLLKQKYIEQNSRGDVEMHNYGMAKALTFIKEHPWRSVALIPFKFAHFWSLEQHLFIIAYSWNYVGPVPAPLAILIFAILLSPFAILTLASVFAIFHIREWNPGLRLLLFVLAYYSAMHSLIFGESRLHMPLIPILAILAAQGFMLLPGVQREWRNADKTAKRSLQRRTLGCALVMAVFVGIWAFSIHYNLDEWKVILSPGGNEAQLPY